MYLNKLRAQDLKSIVGRRSAFCLLMAVSCLFAAGCGVRFDMQDQPRYEVYREKFHNNTKKNCEQCARVKQV